MDVAALVAKLALFPFPSPPTVSEPRLVAAFLSGKSARTIAAYRGDLEGFRLHVGVATMDEAAHALLGRGHGEANATALSYRAELLAAGLAPATINRRLAALRSLVTLARTMGLVPWELAVSNVASVAYRDTRGPGRDGFDALLATLDPLDAKGARDRAVLHLLFDIALRRGEVVSLDLEDVDLEAGTVLVLGKGRREKERLSLPDPTRAALAAWVATRGNEPGALFRNFDRAGKGARLTGTSLYRLVRALGLRAGVRARPHGLRHAAITSALDLTGGDVRAVQRFSRHRDIRTLNRYDDNREDLGGKVASLVANKTCQTG